jgi:hypothetical protein
MLPTRHSREHHIFAHLAQRGKLIPSFLQAEHTTRPVPIRELLSSKYSFSFMVVSLPWLFTKFVLARSRSRSLPLPFTLRIGTGGVCGSESKSEKGDAVRLNDGIEAKDVVGDAGGDPPTVYDRAGRNSSSGSASS